jgi:transposase
VSAIARSHGLDPSKLFALRRKALASGVVAPLSGARGRAVKFADFKAVASEMMEIVIGVGPLRKSIGVLATYT